MTVKVKDIIAKLQRQVDINGNTELIHEDEGCHLYTLSRVWYDEVEKCIRIS